VEAAGYDVLLMPDHAAEPELAYAPALMAAAAATTSLRLGTFVLDNNFRHPALVAREAATLDMLSGGRFELGIGGGWLRANFDQTGVRWPSPRERAERLEESVQIIQALLSRETVTFSGTHYTINDLRGFPQPRQQPRLPILVGAGGKRMLQFAAREADIIGLAPRSLPGGGLALDLEASGVDEQLNWICDAAGDRMENLELNFLLQRVIETDDRHAVASELSEQWQTPANVLLASPFMLIGSADEMAETLRERRQRWGISYYACFDNDMHSMNAVLTRLSGA
jgi:probable F420-dependent oxidoreductase